MKLLLCSLLLLPAGAAAAASGLSQILSALQTHPHGTSGDSIADEDKGEGQADVASTTKANHSAHNHYSGSLPRQVHATQHRSHDKEHVAARRHHEKPHQPSVSGGETDETKSPPEDRCGLYLAPSTIPGAGLGLFAGVDFEEGSEVTPGDAMVPVRDMNWHNSVRGFTNSFLWDEYVWSGATFKGMPEPFIEIDGASFGVGAAPNCFFPLINVEDDNNSIRRDYAGLPRTSPSIGSFTPWHDRVSHAVQDIPAGEELFVDYGYGYFDTGRQHLYGLIPFLDDFPRADQILQKYLEVLETMEEDLAQPMSNDLYDLVKGVLLAFPTRTRMALPEDATQIPALLENGGTAMRDYERSRRSVKELQEQGSCIDHLIVKPSTIPEAGRGAFAKRSLKKGSVVAPVPLIHLPDRAVLDMYERGVTDPDTGEAKHASDEPVHAQLLLNYCYGHSKSTLLLCPYGVVSTVVNHHATKANVQIVWSEKITSKPEWLKLPLEEWAHNYQAGLGFDYVALRDIEEGEEIFVNYSSEWQRAWDEHVANWEPIERRVDLLNEDIDSIIPTESEWQWTMGNPNENSEAVNLWCYDIYREMRGLPELSPEEPNSWPCKVLRRESNGGDPLYTAEIVQRLQNENHEDEQCLEVFDEILFAVPRDAFVFGGLYEHEDTREYAQPWTFRHDLRIPDEIMPEEWKNIDAYVDDEKTSQDNVSLDEL